MEEDIEIEYIGNLTKEKFLELQEKLKTDGEFLKQKNRVSFMYFRDYIPKDIFEISNEDIDLRIRITNGIPELVIKKGLFTGSHSRKEVLIAFSMKDLEKYINFLSIFGWNIGVIYSTKTQAYKYKGVELSLVDIKNYGYNFEAEILSNLKDTEKSKKKILSILNELGLSSFSEKELNNQCNSINNIKELQFDFSKESFKQFKNKFIHLLKS